jgi:CD2 antigen cytoplasmic tail-binding protein 2
VVPSRSGKKKEGAGEDEDEDMFGELSGDEGAKDKGKSKEEKKEFLNLTDIEGQDFGHKSGNYVGERSDDDDSEYDSEEEQRKAAEGKGLDGPMAAELTAFNMKSELTEGRMTADGESYQTNDRDPHEQYDRWLEGTDRSAVRKARRAKREQDRAEKQREEREKEEQTGEGRREKEAGLMRGIVELLDRGETVLEGLQRHGADLEKERKKVSKEKGKKQTWAEKQRERRAILEGHGSTASGDMQVDE